LWDKNCDFYSICPSLVAESSVETTVAFGAFLGSGIGGGPIRVEVDEPESGVKDSIFKRFPRAHRNALVFSIQEVVAAKQINL